MRFSPFNSFKRLSLTVALVFSLAATSGIATALFSRTQLTSDSSTVATVPQSSDTIVSTTLSPPVNSTSSTIPIDSLDFTSRFIDTNNEEAARLAWRTVNSRPLHRMNWTGSVQSCRAGKTDNLFKEDILYRVQWFRAMAGVNPKIVLNEESNRLAQEAALVMAAANDLSHTPDSDWPCYSQAAYDGASESNLYLGLFGVPTVDGYIEDSGDNNYEVGHRRWILDPTLFSIGTGDTRNSNALFLTNSETDEKAEIREDNGFVMWPPRGYVPRSQIYDRWSISHQTADFSRAVVTVSHNGKTRVFKDPHSDSEGYGSMNSLVFNWPRPAKGSGPIHVTVKNIELNRLFTTFEYDVLPFS